MTSAETTAASKRAVLAASALDERSDEVVATAWRLAARFGAELVIVHAVPLPHLVPTKPVQAPHPIETLAARATQQIEAQALRVQPAGSPPAKIRVEPGPADLVIANAASELGAGLIVLGATTSHGRLGKLLGSTAERLLQIAPVPTLVVRDELPVPPQSVLAPVDLSSLSYDALASGAAWLSGLAAASPPPPIRCELLCIVPPVEHGGLTEPAALQQAQVGVESVAAQLNAPAIRFATRVLAGEPRDQILRTLEEFDYDLVLMGTRGWGGLRHRLGVVATDVAREAPCSVLLIPPAKSFGDSLAQSVHELLAPAAPATHPHSARGATP